MLGVQNEREFANFCTKVLGNAALATDSRFATNSSRTKNRAELKAEIDRVFSQLSAAQVIERLDDAAIANASVNDMQGVWNHPQLRARGRWTEVDTPAGRVPALLPPGMGDGVKARMDAVPEVGQHNEAILKELGIER
jgi:crotonobetainyl-CoA:carnitine CoA-transferase CaiB-like acyl-CoA transferase